MSVDGMLRDGWRIESQTATQTILTRRVTVGGVVWRVLGITAALFGLPLLAVARHTQVEAAVLVGVVLAAVQGVWWVRASTRRERVAVTGDGTVTTL